MADPARMRGRSFAKNYPIWITLSHFLSAPLVRELARAFVPAVSRNAFRLEDLCEERLSGGAPQLATWVIRMHERRSGVAGYLQDVLRALAWQTDRQMSVHDDVAPEDRAAAKALECSLELSACDFSNIHAWRVRAVSSAPRSLLALADAIIRAREIGAPDDSAPGAGTNDGLVEFDLVLRVMLAKHVGDLFFDVDDANQALVYYDRARAMNQTCGDDCWRTLTTSLNDMIVQSRAAMLGLIEGPASAVHVLGPIVEAPALNSRPLLSLNASLDAMSARYKSTREFVVPDIRPCVLATPLLQPTQHFAAALENWTNGKFDEAHHRFWALLRRLTALGGGTLSAEAMALYGRSMLAQLGAETRRHRSLEMFATALRLVVASGRQDAVGPDARRRDLVDAYVTRDAVRLSLEIAGRHEGAKLDRLEVVIKLFGAWLGVLAVDQAETASSLIRELSAVSCARLDDPPVLGRSLTISCLEVLKEVAENRPEFIEAESGTLANAIVSVLRTKRFRLVQAALEAAVACSEGFKAEDLELCIEAVLDVLEDIEPGEGPWPLVRPAITLVSSEEAQELWPDKTMLAARSAHLVLRHGLGSVSENVRLLSLLNHIVPYLDRGAAESEPRIEEAVRAVREGARNINNSAVTSRIAVLFTVPALVGRAGIDDAMHGLLAILGSVRERSPSFVLAHAYEPLNALTHYMEEIFRTLAMSPSEQMVFLAPLIASLKEYWQQANINPLVFAPFQIPARTAPDPIIVQNWAFVTFGFARRAGVLEQMREAMLPASQNSMLERSIALGSALRATAGESILSDPSEIRSEEREPFYAVLGNRLAQLTGSLGDEWDAVCAALVDQCLKHGPNGLDAGAFALALRIKTPASLSEVLVKSYGHRLDRDPVLNRGLRPLLRQLVDAGHRS